MKKILLLICFVLPLHGAELLLKVGDGGAASFEDGDIIHAFNDKEILNVHAQVITHVKLTSTTKDNLRYPGTLLEKYLEETSEYKFIRTGSATVNRIDLATLDEQTFSDKTKEYIHVQQAIDFYLEHPRHKVFGTLGAEYWYGGTKRITNDTMDAVWDGIEARGQHDRADYDKFPFSDKTLSKYYAMPVEDFTDAERREYVAPVESQLTGKITEARKNEVDYNALNLTAKEKADIADPKVKVDHRDSKTFDKPSVGLQP